MNTRSIRADDVARIAGVSRSTVSRVFTPGTTVAVVTRDRVLQAADLIGYRPNIIARSLTMRKTRLVGVVVGDLVSPFYSAMLARISRELQDAGMAALLFRARYDEVETVMRHLLSYQIDGLIVTSAVPTAGIAAEYGKVGIPIVVVNRPAQSQATRSVSSDNSAGCALIIDHLLERGSRRIAYIAGIAGLVSSEERHRGLSDALAARGLALAGQADGHYAYAGAEQAMRRLLTTCSDMDAVVCANDAMAVAAIDVIRLAPTLAEGRRIRIVGYDNSPVAGLPGYDLTSVDQDIDAIARHAVDLAIAVDGGGEESTRSVRIRPRLKIRGSSL